MASKCYKLSTTVVVSGAAAAVITITRSGYITAVNWASSILAGAATTGQVIYQLALNQSTSSISTNDTPGTDISTLSVPLSISAGANGANRSDSGFAIPVQAGDKLYIHAYGSGQAAASGYTNCHVMVT